jgi:tetratricopeptide (TPR) repeat protein
MRSCIALSSLLVIALTSGRALADDAKLARQHFADGSKLYDLGKFRDAAREYEEAYKAKPDPALLFNIGQAYRAAGDASEAVTAYKSYLRHVPDAPNRVEVEGLIAKLQQKLDDDRRAQELKQQQQRQQQQQQQLVPTPQPQLVATAPAAEEKKPLYKKWWLWTAVGGVLVVGGAVAIAVAATTPKDAASPSNTFGVSLR